MIRFNIAITKTRAEMFIILRSFRQTKDQEEWIGAGGKDWKGVRGGSVTGLCAVVKPNDDN